MKSIVSCDNMMMIKKRETDTYHVQDHARYHDPEAAEEDPFVY